MQLKLNGVTVRYGAVEAVKDLSMHVDEHAIVTLIGSNGAGKSTVLRAISGLIKPSSGEIIFGAENISRAASDKIVKLGIAHVPERAHVFKHMSVMENLLLGTFSRHNRSQITADVEEMFRYFPILKERSGQSGGSLSGGEQQMLAIARALMARPNMLLLDEPSLGLAPKIVSEIGNIIRELNVKRNVSILLIEQNARLALKLAEYGYVIETGSVVMEGSAAALLKDDGVRRAYLGG
jgi:branched-chain amino acid transport system ATP-binding protein